MTDTKPKEPGVWRGLLWLSGFLVLLLAWKIIVRYSLPHLIDWLGEDLVKLWSQPYFNLGDVPVTPTFLIKSLFYLVLVLLVARFIRRVVRYQVLDRTYLDMGQKFAMERGLGYVVVIIGLVVGLQSTGVNLSSLMVLGGAIGIGIGLGLQAVTNNFISGIILLIERSIKIGDRVEVGALNGDVEYIGPRATWIRTNDNIVVVVPNAEFTEQRVTNWTANDRQIRFSLPLGVAYGSDPEKVRDVLLDVAAAHPDVLQNPKPDVIFTGFGESALNFELRVWTIQQVQTPQVLMSQLYFPIFRAFRENGIEIPFPQRDLHLKSVDIPIPLRRDSE